PHSVLHSFPTRRSSDLEFVRLPHPLGSPYVIHKGQYPTQTNNGLLVVFVGFQVALKQHWQMVLWRLIEPINHLCFGLAHVCKVSDRKSTRLNSSHVSIS